jgi:hypothetical protein
VVQAGGQVRQAAQERADGAPAPLAGPQTGPQLPALPSLHAKGCLSQDAFKAPTIIKHSHPPDAFKASCDPGHPMPKHPEDALAASKPNATRGRSGTSS